MAMLFGMPKHSEASWNQANKTTSLQAMPGPVFFCYFAPRFQYDLFSPIRLKRGMMYAKR